VSSMAQDGYSTPTYAYALNNPIRYTDPTGKNPLVIPAAAIGIAVGEALVATGVMAAGVYCIGTQCLGNLHWPGSPSSTMPPNIPSKTEGGSSSGNGICEAAAGATVVSMANEVAPRWRCNGWFTKCLGTSLGAIPGRCAACRDTCIGKKGYWPATDWNGNECLSVQ
jgi:hypothetical protein